MACRRGLDFDRCVSLAGGGDSGSVAAIGHGELALLMRSSEVKSIECPVAGNRTFLPFTICYPLVAISQVVARMNRIWSVRC